MAEAGPKNPGVRFADLKAAMAKKAAQPAAAPAHPKAAAPGPAPVFASARSKPAPDGQGRNPAKDGPVSPYGETALAGAHAEKPAGPQKARDSPPAPKPAAPGKQPGTKPGEPVEVGIGSPIGIDLFAPQAFNLRTVMIENKAGIRHRCPNLKHIWITLRLERGAYSVVKCEPPQVGAMLNEKFAKVLRAMAGHAKTVGPDDVFTCKFVQTFGNAQSEGSGLEVLKDLQPQPDMRTSVQLLGLGVERTNAVGAVPRFMDICNWHPLPGEAGYAFVLFEGPERKRMACEVKPVIREDGTCRVFALSKVVDGRRSRMQDIPFSMESRDERYGFPAEGIEISFTTLKNGDKAIRVDPFDQAREAESGAYGWKEKAAAALGLATAGGLLAFPEITGLLNNPFPESVAIGPYTITARYVLGTAAMTVLCAVGMLIDLFRSKNDTGDVK